MTTFRGFLIQPRLGADDTTVVGSFASPGPGGDYRLSFCVPPEVYQFLIQLTPRTVFYLIDSHNNLH